MHTPPYSDIKQHSPFNHGIARGTMPVGVVGYWSIMPATPFIYNVNTLMKYFISTAGPRLSESPLSEPSVIRTLF